MKQSSRPDPVLACRAYPGQEVGTSLVVRSPDKLDLEGVRSNSTKAGPAHRRSSFGCPSVPLAGDVVGNARTELSPGGCQDPEAGHAGHEGRTSRGPPSCFRTSRPFPPAGGSRKRGVRFLLHGSDQHEGAAKSPAEVISLPTVVAPGEEEAVPEEIVEETARESSWVCEACEKRNDYGRTQCAICGRRYLQQNTRSAVAGASGGNAALGSAGKRARDARGRVDTEGWTAKGGGGGQRGGREWGGPPESAADAPQRRNGGNRERSHETQYDFSSFARMKQSTEPMVRARLGLKGEIKSLLSAIRKR